MTKLIALFLGFLCSPLFGREIHIICTSALIPKQFELRKQEYLDNIRLLRSYGIDPWMIESTDINHSFYDAVTDQVLYPRTNNYALRNKGVNEFKSIRESIPYLPFDDDDIVIKLTGRYFLEQPHFIDVIKETSSDYDAYVSFGQNFIGPEHVFTGCFALRWKYFKQMLLELDLEQLERDQVPVEQVVADFVNDPNLRMYKFDKLFMRARIFFSGEDAQWMNF